MPSVRLKVMTVLGTRPELIRLSRVLAVFDDVFDHVLVHTGQNYDPELNASLFSELRLRAPDHDLKAARPSVADTIAAIISGVDGVLAQSSPDALLVLGDTNSCLAVIPAKRRKIPVFHMEAGNRCFDMRVPEEINRRIVDHVSDINLCYTEHGRRHLLGEGLPADRIIRTGSPLKEVLDYYRPEIDASSVLSRLGLAPRGYLVVSLHREENVDDPSRLRLLLHVLESLAKAHGLPLVFSMHPRTRARIAAAGLALHPLVKAIAPLGFADYIALQRSAFCTVSDSGTVTEEAALLGFPAVTVREAHERHEGIDEGSIIMAGIQPERVLQAVALARAAFDRSGGPRVPADYNVDEVSWTVAKVVIGYTDYVNRTVWGK